MGEADDAALASECRGRQADEAEALAALYGGDGDGGDAAVRLEPPAERGGAAALHVALPLAEGGEAGGEGTVRVVFRLPPLYPAVGFPAAVLVDAASGAAAAQAAGQAALDAGARDGVESLWKACEAVLEAVRAAVAELAADRAAATARQRRDREERAEAAGTGEAPHNAVVRIDHMNCRKTYCRLLERWSGDLGLGVRLFFRAGGLRRPKGAEGVLACLSGAPEAIGAWLHRLRTEYVDVDARGAKCKERQSTVLANRRPGDVKAGEAEVPAFRGFAAEEYRSSDELEAGLAALNLLHCGDGNERFHSGE